MNYVARDLSRQTPVLGALTASVLLAFGVGAQASPVVHPALQAQEKLDHRVRWVSQDVVYIIMPEERGIFERLTTEEEQTAFIEQFWARRDPTPGTAENEFKTEHYRRIQYANERFTSGYDGWKTDRGRIYILFGPPDQTEEHHGGRYDRPYYEGGGTTAAFPFQIWRYRHIQGVGDDIEIEFVDTTETGDYRIVIDEQEKDVFLTVPGVGLTLDEQAGRLSRGDRIDNRLVSNPNYFKYMREKDLPFARIYLRASLDKPPAVLQSKFREEVNTRIFYAPILPFQYSVDFVRLNEERALVLLNLEIANRHLTYRKNEGELDQATIEIYGSVQSLRGQVVNEFEQRIFSHLLPQNGNGSGPAQKVSLFQRQLLLSPGVYKLELMVKDLNSGQLGTRTLRIPVPHLRSGGSLSFSTLILCRGLVPLRQFPERASMFVLGDLKVWPSIDRRFKSHERMGIYLQVYDFAIDQSTLQPALAVGYEVLRGEEVVKSLDDGDGQSIGFVSGQRAVITNGLKLEDLAPGQYTLRLTVTDRITGCRTQIRSLFQVTSEEEAL